MRIAIIGSGYVGLVTGAAFARSGHRVVAVDREPARIAALEAGEMPFHEPGLAEMVADGVRSGRLGFSTDTAAAVAGAAAVFLAVGTPAGPGDGRADLGQLFEALRAVAAGIDRFAVLAVKSTVPAGTGDEIERRIAELRPDADIAVVSNPEFLREGSAVADVLAPDRIVVGTDDPRARAVMAALYGAGEAGAPPVLFTGRRNAELVKHAANAFLAMKVSFVNEMADLCEAIGADVEEVARGIGLDRRIGPAFLRAGPGFGGSCFPKDLQALVRTGEDAGVDLRLAATTIEVNLRRQRTVADKVVSACGGSVAGKTIAILGLAFKPDTDDLRAAPALDLARRLLAAGARIRAHDPVAMPAARTVLDGVAMAGSPYEAAAGAEALVLVTEWDCYRRLDTARLHAVMARPRIVDLRNLFDPEDVVGRGFDLVGVGRPARRGLPVAAAAAAAE